MDDLSSCGRTNNWGHREERWKTDERRKKLQDYEILLLGDRFGDEVKRGLWQHLRIPDRAQILTSGFGSHPAALMLLSADSHKSQNDNQRLSNLAPHNAPDVPRWKVFLLLVNSNSTSFAFQQLSWVKQPLPRYQLTRSMLSGGNLKSSLGDHKVVVTSERKQPAKIIINFIQVSR